MKNPKERRVHFEKKYNRQKEQYERMLRILNKKIDTVDTLTHYQELEKEKEQLIKAWNAFQKRHQADLNKLEKLIDTHNEVATTLAEYTITPQPSGLHNPQQDQSLLQQHMQEHLNRLDTEILGFFTEDDGLIHLINHLEYTDKQSDTNPD